MPNHKRLTTDLQIRALKPPSVRIEHPIGGALYLIHTPSGRKSWAFRYRRFGKPAKLTLGPFVADADLVSAFGSKEPALGEPLSLARARLLAQRAALIRDQGHDPALVLAAKVFQARPTEVVAAFDRFHAEYVVKRNRSSTAKETERLFRKRVEPIWKGRALSSLRRSDVTDLLRDIAEAGAPISANRVLALVRKFLNWCVEQSLLDSSPAANVRAPSIEHSRERVLTDEEIAEFWRGSALLEPTQRAFYRTLLLTGQRRGEVASMRWSDLNLEDGIWQLKGTQTKNKVPHVVYLSPLVVTELSSLARVAGQPDYVFTTGRSRNGALTHLRGFSKLKKELDGAIASAASAHERHDALARQPWRIHDLRRTLASGMQQLGVEERVVEKIINHGAVRRGIVGVYQVYDFAIERRTAMKLWEDQVTAVVASRQ